MDASKTSQSKDQDVVGYAIFIIDDSGPSPLIYKNIPFTSENSEIDHKLLRLGVYVSVVVSQGRGGQNIGLYGPLPWAETPSHNLMMLAFIVENPDVKDSRKLKHGVMAFIIIFIPRFDNKLIEARIALEKTLISELTQDGLIRPVLTKETASSILKRTKKIVVQTLLEGAKIIQETSLDEILNDNRVQALGFFSEHTYELIFNLIGDETLLRDNVHLVRDIKMALAFIKLEKFNIGFIRFPFYNSNALGIFDRESFNVQDFVAFIGKLQQAAPLIISYLA
ncbi:MAG: hypothetical protein ACXAC7_07395 [Candidatus Hodarchaeales archaeon]|jgi:hypothetical protein